MFFSYDENNFDPIHEQDEWESAHDQEEETQTSGILLYFYLKDELHSYNFEHICDKNDQNLLELISANFCCTARF